MKNLSLMLLVFLIPINSFAKAHIQFLSFESNFYKAPKASNISEYCPADGNFEIRTLKLLKKELCTQPIGSYENVRVVIKDMSDLIYINQDKSFVVNSKKCKISSNDAQAIINEIMLLMANIKRAC